MAPLDSAEYKHIPLSGKSSVSGPGNHRGADRSVNRRICSVLGKTLKSGRVWGANLSLRRSLRIK